MSSVRITPDYRLPNEKGNMTIKPKYKKLWKAAWGLLGVSLLVIGFYAYLEFMTRAQIASVRNSITTIEGERKDLESKVQALMAAEKYKQSWDPYVNTQLSCTKLLLGLAEELPPAAFLDSFTANFDLEGYKAGIVLTVIAEDTELARQANEKFKDNFAEKLKSGCGLTLVGYVPGEKTSTIIKSYKASRDELSFRYLLSDSISERKVALDSIERLDKKEQTDLSKDKK